MGINNLKQFFFDLDGPILDVSQKYYEVYSDLLRERRYKAVSKAEYWNAKRAHIPESEIISWTCSPDFVKPYIEKRRAVIEDFYYLKFDVVWEGVAKMLSNLSKSNKVYLVSMRNHRTTLMQELKYFNLLRFFAEIFSQDDNSGDWKVKHDLIKDAIESTENTIIIGDTEADVIAGRRLGIRTCAVTCGIRSIQKLEESKPDMIFGNVASFYEFYKKQQSH